MMHGPINIRFINLVITPDDISSFVMSGGILFKMLALGINEMVLYLSYEVLKGYSLFLIYKTNVFIKLLNYCRISMIFRADPSSFNTSHNCDSYSLHFIQFKSWIFPVGSDMM